MFYNNNKQQQQHSLFSQTSWGRLEMKPESLWVSNPLEWLFFMLVCQNLTQPSSFTRAWDRLCWNSNEPSVAQEPSLDHSRQAKPNWVKTRRPRTACWTKLGAVGPPGRPTDLLVGRPGPWAPLPQFQHVAPPCWLLKSVPGASARGSLL